MESHIGDHADGPTTPPTPAEVRKFYQQLREIEPAGDRWLQVQSAWIKRFLRGEYLVDGSSDLRSCLNLGSCGLGYEIPEDALLHVDLDRSRFSDHQDVLIADIQDLPPILNGFQSCLCVGSVLNHCDAARVITCAGNALRPGGTFVLEFDTSASLALVGSPHFTRSAAVVPTFYQGRTVKLWVYSETYVRGLLEAQGFEVRRRSGCHYISPLAYRLFRNSNFAAFFHVLDGVARCVPGLRTYACNVILSCRKHARS